MTLMPHQVEALEAAQKHLARTDRVHDVLACGTGKTLIGRALADAHAPTGRVLVLVPWIHLISQAIADYRRLGPDTELGRVLIVCSQRYLTRDPRLSGLEARTSTDPVDIAAHLDVPGRLTVFATYSSAVMTLIEAHHRHGLAPWDLVQYDEAHHLAGTGTWTRLHSDEHLPARARRYTTATARVLTASQQAQTPEAASMNDLDIFGARSYTLGFAEAVERGLLAPWRVVAAVVTDDQVAGLSDRAESLQVGRAGVAADVLAAQLAVLKALDEFGGRRLLTFHPRVVDAKMWAAVLPGAAELLEDGAAIGVGARHLNADHTPGVRARVLDWFGAPASPGGDARAITNVRLFREGFDAPGCDTIALTYRCGSTIDLIQTLSRALRADPARPDKVATFIVPLRLRAGQSLDEALAAREWDVLRQALRALGSMDASVYAGAAQMLRAHGARTGEAAADVAGPDWLHVRGIPVPRDFADSIGLAVSRALVPPTEEYLGAAEAYVGTHGHLVVPGDHVTAGGVGLGRWLRERRDRYNQGQRSGPVVDQLNALGMVWNQMAWKLERGRQEADAFYRAHGHLRVPSGQVTASGFALGNHIAGRRTAYRSGRLSTDEIAWWEQRGMVWRVLATEEAAYRAALDAYYRTHDHINVPFGYVAADGTPLGVMLSTRRHSYRKGRLCAEAIAFHEARNVLWDASALSATRGSDTRWEYGYRIAKAYAAAHGHLRLRKRDDPVSVEDGRTFGLFEWLQRNRRRWNNLEEAKRQRLLAIGFTADENDTGANPRTPGM